MVDTLTQRKEQVWKVLRDYMDKDVIGYRYTDRRGNQVETPNFPAVQAKGDTSLVVWVGSPWGTASTPDMYTFVHRKQHWFKRPKEVHYGLLVGARGIHLFDLENNLVNVYERNTARFLFQEQITQRNLERATREIEERLKKEI